MTAQGRIGHGAKLYRGDVGTPTNFVEIPGCTEITPPMPERDTLESTEMHEADERKRYVKGLVDLNVVTAQMNIKNGETVYKNLRGDILSGTARYFRVAWPDGATVDFTALVTSLPQGLPNQGLMTGTLSLRPDGENLTYTDV